MGLTGFASRMHSPNQAKAGAYGILRCGGIAVMCAATGGRPVRSRGAQRARLAAGDCRGVADFPSLVLAGGALGGVGEVL
jgi:hypothetical protein